MILRNKSVGVASAALLAVSVLTIGASRGVRGETGGHAGSGKLGQLHVHGESQAVAAVEERLEPLGLRD